MVVAFVPVLPHAVAQKRVLLTADKTKMLTSDELRKRLIQSELCKPNELRGCSEKQLQRIEHRLGHLLPQEYKKLMRVIGRGAGIFMSDLDVFYPGVVTLTKRIRQLLAETIELPKDAYVVASRYGEQVLFIDLGSKSKDPPVYKWHVEQPRRYRKVFSSIWDFIEEELASHETMFTDTKNYRRD